MTYKLACSSIVAGLLSQIACGVSIHQSAPPKSIPLDGSASLSIGDYPFGSGGHSSVRLIEGGQVHAELDLPGFSDIQGSTVYSLRDRTRPTVIVLRGQHSLRVLKIENRSITLAERPAEELEPELRKLLGEKVVREDCVDFPEPLICTIEKNVAWGVDNRIQVE